MPSYYLGMDQGTTGTTALLLDKNWHIVSSGYREHIQRFPRPGWVEQDPELLWECFTGAAEQAFQRAGVSPSSVRCMGVDHQGETVMVWDKETGRPIYPAIVWQDRRTARMVDRLKAAAGQRLWQSTGLIPDTYFSATKLAWILDQVPEARERARRGELLAGTMDAWLVWKLTGGRVHMTDQSTASRTMLMNLSRKEWDRDILQLLDIPPNILPEITDSAGQFGHTCPEAFLGASIPITGVMVDQQAALFGQACTSPGMVKTTYGTGCFLLMNTGRRPVRSTHGLLTTVGWSVDGHTTYALDAGIYIAGAAIQWLKQGLKIISEPSQTDGMSWSAEDNGDVFFVPAFAGLAAPYWDQYARGMIIGITGGTTQAQIVRAVMESIAYQVKDNLDVMEQDSGVSIPRMRADGGLAKNQFLMQFQADILGIPVDIPETTETTALGAAYMAGAGAGVLGGPEELSALWHTKKTFRPSMSSQRREALLSRWHEAVQRARGWARQ